MTEITMPRLSDSMEEGTIVKWLIGDGEAVARGQELVEIETDKATISHLAEAEGVLEIVAPEGTTLPVGATIARIGAAAGGSERERDGAPATAAAGPAPAPVPAQAGAIAPPAVEDAGNGADNGSGSPRAPATPLARRIARLAGVALAEVTGSGPRGRITRADVLQAIGAPAIAPRRTPAAVTPGPSQAPAPDAAPHASAAETEGARGRVTRVALNRSQALVARRMAEAKATIPHFQVQTEVAMDAAVALRTALKASSEQGGAPSLNDLVVKASAIALRRHPRANGSYSDGGFELFERVNVGVAVASEDALVVAVVMDADSRSLGAIARETRRLAERVRSGESSPAELAGATFTVSNLGMYGMTAITPVINPPQAAILGVGALRETLARGERDGEIVQRTLMTLTLSCDHRILYGAEAAGLLAEIRTLLEAPMGLAL